MRSEFWGRSELRWMVGDRQPASVGDDLLQEAALFPMG
jgi:hypothetical protein